MKKRIKYIDIARALAIILIVFGHTIVHNTNSYWLYRLIYSFHIVLFFIISGYIYDSNEDNLTFVKKKFLNLMVPYFVFSILFIIPYFLFGNDIKLNVNSKIDYNILNIIRQIIFGVGYKDALKQNTALWFLPALFTTEVIYKLLDKIKINKVIKMLSLFLVSYLITEVNFILPWGINSALVLLPFYYLGILINKTSFINKIKNNKLYVFILMILTILSIYISQINGTISCVDYRYGNYLYFLITSIIFSLDILLLANIIKNNKLLEYIGKNTLSIFIFHKLPIVFFQSKINFTQKILISGNFLLNLLISLFIVIIAIIFSLAIGLFINKFVPIFYGKCKCKEV